MIIIDSACVQPCSVIVAVVEKSKDISNEWMDIFINLLSFTLTTMFAQCCTFCDEIFTIKYALTLAT